MNISICYLIRNVFLILAVCCLQALLSSCISAGGGDASKYSAPTEQEIRARQEKDKLNSQIVYRGSSGGQNPGDYIIGPADLLEIDVYESEKLSDEVRVSSRGFATLPLVGNIQVEGLSARDLELKYEELLKKGGYINDPHVSVVIKEYRSKVVSIIGNVNDPGEHELLGAETVLDALADAKGLTTEAGNTIYLTRVEPDGGKKSIIIDIDQLLKESNNPELNLDLRPGDVIFVPDAGVVYVEGAVTKPGSYTLDEGKTTLSRIITKAGGVTSYAEKDEVTLVRYESSGERKIYTMDLDSIRKGTEEDPYVQDGDAVIVGINGTRRFFESFRLNLGYGLVGVGYDPPSR